MPSVLFCPLELKIYSGYSLKYQYDHSMSGRIFCSSKPDTEFSLKCPLDSGMSLRALFCSKIDSANPLGFL